MNISVNELLNKKNVNIIDIRNHERYLQSHIPGAINIDSYFLLAYPDKYLTSHGYGYIFDNNVNRIVNAVIDYIS